MTDRPYDLLDDAGKQVFRRCTIGLFSLMIGLIVSHIALFAYVLTVPKFDWLTVEVWFGSTWAVKMLGAAIINRRLSRLYKECQPRDDIPAATADSN
jgi:hypothetical protein